MTRSEDIARLLAAERGTAPPTGLAEAGLNRLLGSLAAHAAPLPVAVGSLHLGWAVVGKWLGVGFVVGLGGAGAAAHISSSYDGSSDVAAPAVVSTAAPVAVALNPVPVEPRVMPSANRPAAVAPQGRSEAAPITAPRPSTASSTRGFDEELRLIAAAKRELDARRLQEARALLEEHRQRFSAGVFGLERDGLSILATCSGKADPRLAQAFASAHPRSHLVRQIQRRCGDSGTTLDTSPAEGPSESAK